MIYHSQCKVYYLTYCNDLFVFFILAESLGNAGYDISSFEAYDKLGIRMIAVINKIRILLLLLLLLLLLVIIIMIMIVCFYYFD